MKTRKLRAKALRAVAAGLMSVTAVGCNTPQLLDPPPASKPKPSAKAARRPAVRAKPTAKPSNAAEDFKERHPSQWRKKLKAAYA